MISRDDVKKLADLARLEIKEEEFSSLAGDMDSILDFIGQVDEVADVSSSLEQGDCRDMVQDGVINVMREDTDANTPGVYTESILAEAPATENGYLKVKKIL